MKLLTKNDHSYTTGNYINYGSFIYEMIFLPFPLKKPWASTRAAASASRSSSFLRCSLGEPRNWRWELKDPVPGRFWHFGMIYL